MAETAPEELVDLATRLEVALDQEASARAARVAVEEAIVDLVGFERPEGQATYEARSGAVRARVTLRQPVSTRFDSKRWPALRRRVDAEARRVVRTKYEIDTAKARALQEKRPDLWAQLSELVTRTPGKVAVRSVVEHAQEED